MWIRRCFPLVMACVAGVICVSPASLAANKFVTRPRDYKSAAFHRYAAMDSASCVSELKTRQIPFAPAAAQSVVTPIRLTGPLQGVTLTHLYHSAEQSAKSPGSIMDCRLVLALDDFCADLATRKITELGYLSAYRRPKTPPSVSGQRHPAALALDIAWFRLTDGSRWTVQTDFHGQLGAKTCGQDAIPPTTASAAATGLRALVCDQGKNLFFNLVLSPNYNRDHHDHIHVEVRPDTHWMLIH